MEEGYSVVDLNLRYRLKNWDFGIAVQNLFDPDWNKTQFATEPELILSRSPWRKFISLRESRFS